MSRHATFSLAPGVAPCDTPPVMQNNDITTALAAVEANPTSHAGTPEWLAAQIEAAQAELAELAAPAAGGGIFGAYLTPAMVAQAEAERLDKIEACAKCLAAKVGRHREAAAELANWRAAQ